MRITRLSISNFRGIKSAEFYFDGHALLIGPNNVGKSTVCEALDLVLGPDRLSKRPPVEEFDFYNAQYLIAGESPEDKPSANPIRIEATLVDLTPEVENRCAANLEFWNQSEQRILISGELEAANPPDVVTCLRLETLARYNIEEDEFEAETYFSHSPNAEEGELTPIRRNIKRLFGFLYLRALRTGSRALSLEHGGVQACCRRALRYVQSQCHGARGIAALSEPHRNTLSPKELVRVWKLPAPDALHRADHHKGKTRRRACLDADVRDHRVQIVASNQSRGPGLERDRVAVLNIDDAVDRA